MPSKYFFIFCLFLCLFLPLPAIAQVDIDTSSPFLPDQQTKKISMDFQDAPLIDVLKIFSKQTNMNLVTSDEVASKKVTVYLDNVPVNEALEQILRANSLTYEIQPDTNIFIVRPLTKPNIELLTRVYQLKNASIASAKINTTLSVSASNNDVTSSSGGAATTVDANTGIIAALRAILTGAGKITEDPRTNSLIVTDISSNFPRIEQTLARLDVALPQILIEVEMLEVSKNTADLIGVKWGDTPLKFNGAQKDGRFPFDNSIPFLKGPTGSAIFTDPRYRVATLDASGFTYLIQFLTTQTDTKNLARPRIITMDNEPAQIRIATDEAIGVKTDTSSSQSNSVSSVEAERAKTGVFLTVTPQTNTITNEITMAIVPKVIIARPGETFDGKTFRDPEERGSQSLLRVKDGETIVLGGLLRVDETGTITKVPFLGDLPLVGHIFRHKDKNANERELIIFLTPHILNDDLRDAKAATISAPIVREQDAPESRTDLINKEISKEQL